MVSLLLEGLLERVLVYGRAKQYARDAPIEGFVDLDFVGCLHTK